MADDIPADRFPGAEQAPLSYPGKWPPCSYCYIGGTVRRIRLSEKGDPLVGHDSRLMPLDHFLAHQLGSPTVAERFLVLAVGSNACPGRLKEKYHAEHPRAVIPVIQGQVSAVDSVYVAALAPYAALPATCIAAHGTTVQVWATLLTRDQLEVMNSTESSSARYELVKTPGPFQFGAWKLEPAYAYYSPDLLMLDKSLVRLKAFRAVGSRLPAADQREVLQRVLDKVGFQRGKALKERHRVLYCDEQQRREVDRLIKRHLRWQGPSRRPGPLVERIQRMCRCRRVS